MAEFLLCNFRARRPSFSALCSLSQRLVHYTLPWRCFDQLVVVSYRLSFLARICFQHARHTCIVHFLCHRFFHDTELGVIRATSHSRTSHLDSQKPAFLALVVRQTYCLSSSFSSHRLLLLRQPFTLLCHRQLSSSCHQDLHLSPSDFSSSLHLLLGVQSPYCLSALF